MSETLIRIDQLDLWEETIFPMSSDLCCESQVEGFIARDQNTAQERWCFPENANGESRWVQGDSRTACPCTSFSVGDSFLLRARL